MTQNLISVITPSFKSENTILQTIDSVLKQDYENIEYIITDDGTKNFDYNKISAYIEENKQDNIKNVIIIKKKRNKGTIKNLNQAINLANGEIIFNLSADDCFYDKKVIIDWVKAFDESGADIITAKRAVYDSTLTNFIEVLPKEHQIDAIKNLTPIKLFEFMASSNFIFGSCTARTKKFYEKFGCFDEKYKWIEDYSSNLQILREGQKIVFLDRIVIQYRLGGVSTNNRVNKAYLKENKRIFKNEAIPYLADKNKAMEIYNTWQSDVESITKNKWLEKNLENKQQNKINKFRVLFAYYLRNKPFYAIKKILKNPSILKNKLEEKTMDIRKIIFQQYNDNRGNLVVAETGKELDFSVKRIYYIYNVDSDKKRGFHSHKNLEQVFIAINGSCKIKFFDGKSTEIVELNKPNEGLHVGNNIWREMYDFSADAILLVLASENFNEKDYIRDYNEFLKSQK